MKTGLIRKLEEPGRIVIPKELRDELKLDVGMLLEFEIINGKLTIEKFVSSKDYKSETERLKECIKNDTDLDKEKLNVIEKHLSAVIDELQK